jgi:hypothetical protein
VVASNYLERGGGAGLRPGFVKRDRCHHGCIIVTYRAALNVTIFQGGGEKKTKTVARKVLDVEG